MVSRYKVKRMQKKLDLKKVIEDAKRHDVEALSHLYDEFFDKIYRYIFIRVRSKEVAEDLSSQTFLRLLEKISDFTWRGSGFSAWLFRIANNLVIDWFRVNKEVSKEIEVEDEKASTEYSVITNESFKEVILALKTLTDNQQQVIILRLVSGLTCRETAEVLDLSEANVRTLQYRALTATREELKVKADA